LVGVSSGSFVSMDGLSGSDFDSRSMRASCAYISAAGGAYVNHYVEVVIEKVTESWRRRTRGLGVRRP
jgi:hypothetical protein